MRYDSNRGRHPTITEEGIYGFFDEYRFLSNFHICNVSLDGILYKSSEAAYMACKTNNRELKLEFSKIENPGDAKRLGRSIKLRDDWEQVKVLEMTRVLFSKFCYNDILKQKLIATKDLYLEETNDWNDTFWGADAFGRGHNMLGKCLMHIRCVVKVMEYQKSLIKINVDK